MVQKIKAHFQYNWWKYLAVSVVCIVIWNGLFEALAQPNENEKLTVASFVQGIDAEAMQTKLEANKDNITDQAIKTVSVEEYLDYADSSMYFSYALAAADVFIFSEDMVTPDKDGNVPVTYKGLFKPIPMDKFSEILGERAEGLRLFEDNGEIYGIYLTYEAVANNFTEVCEEGISCILFFNPDSVNLNALYGKGNAEDGAAVDLLLYLLESK